MNIFYFAFAHNRPTGGNKHAYRHVDLLNAEGMRAAAYHNHPTFERYTWFENRTRVVSPAQFAQVFDPNRDIIVFPEDLGPRMLRFPGRKVIFNRNIYLGAQAFGRKLVEPDPYLDPTVEAAFAVSDHNAEYLRFAYPDLPVLRVQAEIDSELFAFTPLARKRRQIATNTKASVEVLTLMHLLRARADGGHNALADVEWVFLEGKSEREMVSALRDSLLFVSLSTQEGLARMPAEALACGALVAAYDVGGQREYLPPECRFAVGDFLGMARWIERVAGDTGSGRAELQKVAKAGRQAVTRYSFAAQRDSVLSAWAAVLDDRRRVRKAG